MASEFAVQGTNAKALFTLKLHRGDGMTLLGMNWKQGTPPNEFVGFAIEYQEPKGDRFFALKNRLGFLGKDGKVDPTQLSTRLSPIQMFRWVHFPRNANLDGDFIYRVTPVFMNAQSELSYGEAQEAPIALSRDTYKGELDVCFTRGFVSSQAFVDRYEKFGKINTLVAPKADGGLSFKPTHPKKDEALEWMGFEARRAILDLLDEAIKDTKAQVRVVAYDLNQPEVVDRLAKLKKRLKIIIDDSGTHGKKTAAESIAAAKLAKTAGAANVKRQHMGGLQHNKTIVVDGPKVKKAVCGSTNFSWRGMFVQSNNAVVVMGAKAIAPFTQAFDDYWNNEGSFGQTVSAKWTDLGLKDIDARIAFSPHAKANALLQSVADDVGKTTSSLLYSMAFLYQTPGAIRDAFKKVAKDEKLFIYGISDKKVKGFDDDDPKAFAGIDVQKPSGGRAPVYAVELAENVPPPFSKEPTGGGGTRMHHKFIVIDFDKPTARVYLGSYNFSKAADLNNGENLVLIKDRRIAVSYMIEALTMFDHYRFRILQRDAKTAKKQLYLETPPKPGGKAWWAEDYSDPRKIRDRELFS